MSTLVDELERVFATAFCPEAGTFHPEAEAALDFLRAYTRRPEVVERVARAIDHPSVYMGGASRDSKRKARAALASIFPDA